MSLHKVVKFVFCISIETFWGETIFEKKHVFLTFSDIEQKKFGFLAKNFRQGFQNRFLHDHEKHPRREKFDCKQNDLFCSTSGFSWKFPAFSRGFFDVSVRSPFYVPWWSFWAKPSFLKKIYKNFESFPDIYWNFFGFLSKYFKRGRQNCILLVHANILRRYFVRSLI